MTPYHPGTHLIATLDCTDTCLLQQFEEYKALVDILISTYELKKLGEVYHNFLPAGFTGIVCLSESHLSIHTWPEYGKINLDIYLSNYQKENDGIVDLVFEAIVQFFKGTILDIQKLKR